MRPWRGRFFPDENPIGRQIRVDLSPEDQPREIIAVVLEYGTVHLAELPDDVPLRTAGDPMSELPAIR
jgi:hypothetical protein